MQNPWLPAFSAESSATYCQLRSEQRHGLKPFVPSCGRQSHSTVLLRLDSPESGVSCSDHRSRNRWHQYVFYRPFSKSWDLYHGAGWIDIAFKSRSFEEETKKLESELHDKSTTSSWCPAVTRSFTNCQPSCTVGVLRESIGLAMRILGPESRVAGMMPRMQKPFRIKPPEPAPSSWNLHHAVGKLTPRATERIQGH